jgi:hypothetical protein
MATTPKKLSELTELPTALTPSTDHIYVERESPPGTHTSYKKSAPSTDDVAEGSTKLYFTLARVLASVLTGLSTATGTAITATDTVLSGFGKLQAQITAVAAATGSIVAATFAEFRANTAGKFLTTDSIWPAAAVVTLTDAATIAVDFNTFINAKVTLAGNRTLGAPTNPKQGQSGTIYIKQDATGGRTLTFHADWEFEGGTDPTLSTAAGAEDELHYKVKYTGKTTAILMKAVA